jgi:hypothetical protein
MVFKLLKYYIGEATKYFSNFWKNKGDSVLAANPSPFILLRNVIEAGALGDLCR